ncbi:MAG TPA: LON peptidase substrate-binding domain-containing protein [Rhodanobacteraceae bacterium]|nr:LON peptidase substrate-binding domain-containing protein [Rhodanobacteraceae bacterium]
MKHQEIALFPLNTVLFPGGLLGLRVFEARYLDMVRECTRTDSAFGICLIMQGGETLAAPALPAAVGTLAHIVDFDTLPDGLLGISVTGGPRFRVQKSRVRDNGLVVGEIRRWPEEPAVEVPVEFALLPTILERLAEQAGLSWRNGPRERYEDASWVGFRLAELLPLGDAERQHLLEMTDPLERLAALRDAVPRFQKP